MKRGSEETEEADENGTGGKTRGIGMEQSEERKAGKKEWWCVREGRWVRGIARREKGIESKGSKRRDIQSPWAVEGE